MGDTDIPDEVTPFKHMDDCPLAPTSPIVADGKRISQALTRDPGFHGNHKAMREMCHFCWQK